jgi:sugar phosphate isomerase/epimerase
LSRPNVAALAGIERHMPMRFAISNLAWPHEEFSDALELARACGLEGIELAPFNIFGRWDVSDEEVRAVRSRIEERGLVCPALQGILYNVAEAQLFTEEGRRAMRDQLGRVARMAGLLGASACVFGAPKQRDPGALPKEEAWETAAAFFRAIGPIFADEGAALAIEANARAYQCRFITTTAEAAEFVAMVDTPGIALQIDMGTVFLEDEDPAVLHAAAPLAAHAHVSEPQLQPVSSAGVDHSATAEALRSSGYRGFLSIEMRAAENWRGAVRQAARTLHEVYA